MVVGRVYRVAGPLVIAEGMSGSMMYEVVEVGEEGLIGEIIGLRGDKAIIQVYEDTTGIGVGDKVVGTGKLLSAELGPGLITSIFDGLQRPLKSLIELVGPFVRRGVKVPSLPRDKKWTFRRSSEVKVGDKVEPGDVLGVVRETPIVEHKIMVPPNVKGVLKEIAPDGDYTIEDVIAVVEDGSRKYEIKMYHHWPVRKPRPYREKLEPRIPLITGVRIIDSLFPLAMGGTAAIPGGFGTGKCVPPGTPVLLADGTIKAIDEIFKEVKGGEPDLSLDEEYIEVKKPLWVYGFDGKRFKKVRVTHVYRGYTEKLIRIRTASGRVIEVTPVHKLLVFDPSGYLKEVEARFITPGTYLAIPRKLEIETDYVRVPIEKLAEYPHVVSRDERVNRKVRELLRNASDAFIKELAEKVGLSPDAIKAIARRGKGSVPLKLVVELNRMFNNSVGLPTLVGLRRSKYTIKVPHVVSEDLAELIGLVIMGGKLTRRSVRFFSDDDVVRKRFSELMEKVFGVRGKERTFGKVKGVEVYSTLVVRLLELLGVSGTGCARVPEAILRSPETVVAAFVRGLYLAGGSFSNGVVEYASASRDLITGLCYLLLRLGILYSCRFGSVSKVLISGVQELRRFYTTVLLEAPMTDKVRAVKECIEEACGGQTRDVVPISATLLKRVYATLSMRAPQTVKVGAGGAYSVENLGVVTASRTFALLSSADVAWATAITKALRNIVRLLEVVAFDMVEEVEVVDGRTVVYDLTVEDTHNFIGGYAPTVYHNTVTLQSVTKWSHADIAIYVGCGERGNEMADALHSFLRLMDHRRKRPMVERSVFIANTSNMPVAARETSVFLGITIAEYFRDMGYNVILVADSTSRWAEAMREISGRLEEMPGEEGFPAYLASRLASFYERAGYVKTLGRPERFGSVTIIGAVSPPGGDFSEPVTQNTLRIVRALYALDTTLANRRHFPAINWLVSYSLYVDLVADWWHKNIGKEWKRYRNIIMSILQRESELEDIVRIAGIEALPEDAKLVLEVARMIRDYFLRQNLIIIEEAYSSPKKDYYIMEEIVKFYEAAQNALKYGVSVNEIRALPVKYEIAKTRRVRDEDLDAHHEKVLKMIDEQFRELIRKRVGG